MGHGHSLLIVDSAGCLRGRYVGFYHHQTRFLSRAALLVNGRRPVAASASAADAHHLAAYFISRPVHAAKSDGRQPKSVIELLVDLRAQESLRMTYALANRGLSPTRLKLSWRLDTDFSDQADLEASSATGYGPVERQWDGRRLLELRSLHPELQHATRLNFDGPAVFTEEHGLIVARLELAPQEQAVIEIEAEPVFDSRVIGELPARAAPAGAEWREGCASLEAPDPLIQSAWDRAADDLRRLQLGDGDGEEQFTPAAGFPHYLALFGRDALMTGWQTALLNPATLRGSLGLLSRWTAEAYEPERDAQPGRVLHQRQLGPAALLQETPFLRYYGDHTASALYLIGLAEAFARTGDRRWFLGYRDLARRVLDWMDRDGDADGDGLYEYRTRAKGGLKNQGWKDSDEAILYPDGRLASDPIVVCEVQAIFYAAKAALASAFRAAGDESLAAELDRGASRARRRFNEAFWMEDEGFVALALDADHRQIRSIASNAGECLAYGVLDTERARRVMERIMEPDLFSGWGIRTLSANHPAYNPLGYHLGSVWPCFTALTVRGLMRHGFDEPAQTLARALFEATKLFDRDRLPELFGGHARDARPHPGLYPNACSPQAWSSGAVILLIDTLVGLRPAAPLGAALVEPRLPDWLPEVTLRNMALGAGQVDLRVWREGSASYCRILADTSGLRLFGPGLDDDAPDPGVRSFVDAMP